MKAWAAGWDDQIANPNSALQRASSLGRRKHSGSTRRQGVIDGGITDLTLEAVEVEESGGLAMEVGAFSLAVPGENNAKVTVAGKYIVVWKKGADGIWRLYRDIWNTNPAE